jgi:hypothetical protein
MAGRKDIPMHPRNQPRTGTIILRLHPLRRHHALSPGRPDNSGTTSITILLRGSNISPFNDYNDLFWLFSVIGLGHSSVFFSCSFSMDPFFV